MLQSKEALIPNNQLNQAPIYLQSNEVSIKFGLNKDSSRFYVRIKESFDSKQWIKRCFNTLRNKRGSN